MKLQALASALLTLAALPALAAEPAAKPAAAAPAAKVSPAAARPEMFPLSGDGVDEGLFGGPLVEGSANVYGYRSVAVPGTVAGLALALERWGTISLAEALAPAIRWAEEGFPVFWHTTLCVARDIGTLRRFPATAAIFLDRDGTINIDRVYINDPRLIELIPGAGAAIRRAQKAGFLIVVVTNQSGIARGIAAYADRLIASGIKVAAIRHSPWQAEDVPTCMARPGATAAACSTSESLAAPEGAIGLAAAMDSRIRLIDTRRFFCFQGNCPVVIGGVLVYRDSHHLTATYARTMAPVLAREIKAAMQ